MCIRKKLFRRTDLQLKNRRGYSLVCSYFETYGQKGQVPCIIYLHANGCSRLEAVQYLETIGINGMSLFCFDFSGSGMSEGNYCSLGWFEQDDLECVIDYLNQTCKVSSIAVWGRSMGAITALLYGKKDTRISCLVLDSPFTSFKQFAKDFAKKKANIPGVVTLAALAILGSSVKSRANFDIDKIDPLSQVSQIKIPAIFAAAQDDSFIPPSHSQELYESYGGTEKQLIFFEGDHNSSRPLTFLCKVIAFLREHLIDAKSLTKSAATTEITKEETLISNPPLQTTSMLNNADKLQTETRMESKPLNTNSADLDTKSQSTLVTHRDDIALKGLTTNPNSALQEMLRKNPSMEKMPTAAQEASNKKSESNDSQIIGTNKSTVKERGMKLTFSWVSESTPNLFARCNSQQQFNKSELAQAAQPTEGDAEVGSENTPNNPNCTPIKQRKVTRTNTATSSIMSRNSSAIALQQPLRDDQRPPRAGLPPSKISIRGHNYERSNCVHQSLPGSNIKLSENDSNKLPSSSACNSEDQGPLKSRDENVPDITQFKAQNDITKTPKKPMTKIIGLAKSNMVPKSANVSLIQDNPKEINSEDRKQEIIARLLPTTTTRTGENKNSMNNIPKASKPIGSLKALRENLNPQVYSGRGTAESVTRKAVEYSQKPKCEDLLPKSLESRVMAVLESQKSSLNVTAVNKNIEEEQQHVRSSSKYVSKSMIPRKPTSRIYSTGLFGDFLMQQKYEATVVSQNASVVVTGSNHSRSNSIEGQSAILSSHVSSYGNLRGAHVFRRRDNIQHLPTRYKVDQRTTVHNKTMHDFSKLDMSQFLK